MDDPGSANRILISVVLLVLLLIVDIFIYLYKAALNKLPDSEAERLTESGKKSVKRIIENREEVFLCTSFCSILLVFLFSFLCTWFYAGMLANAFIGAGVPAVVAVLLAAVILILVGSLLLMTVAGIIPRYIGNKKPVSIIVRYASLAVLFYRLNLPFVKISKGISYGLMKLLRIEKMQEENLATEAEIMSMIEEGSDSGNIDHEQREMIANIFEFDDVSVDELMTHRTDVCAVPADADIAELRDMAVEEGYSRIPVYEETMDHIIGVAYIKDLLPFVGESVPKKRRAGDFVRETIFVPESQPASRLFRDMTEQHLQMAIVVDEYGGTAGIITMEDLLESIVGSIQDEYDDEEEEIKILDDNVFTVDGTINAEEVEELLQLELPEGDYDTLGGFLIELLGEIPEDDSTPETEYGGFKFSVTEVQDQRICRVRITRLSLPAEESETP